MNPENFYLIISYIEIVIYIITIIFLIFCRKSSILAFFIILLVLDIYFETIFSHALVAFRGDFYNALYKIIYHTLPVSLVISYCAIISEFFNKSLKVIPFVFGLLVIALLIADVFTFRQFNTHVTLSDVINFSGDWINSFDMILNFITNDIHIITPIIILLITYSYISFNKAKTRDKMVTWSAMVCFSILFFTMHKPQTTLWDNYFDNILTSSKASVKALKEYSQDYKYRQYSPNILTVPGINLRKNIIIIMVESLSSDYSKLLNGHYDSIPNLDKIAKDNIYFPNYYSEGYNTDTGNFALLNSIPFIHSNSTYYKEKYFYNNLAAVFKKNGYITNVFYSADPIGELNKIWNKSQFTHEYGGYQTFYKNSERLTFNSVPDEDLLDYFVHHLKTSKNQEPFLSLIQTTTTHHPYILPKTHERSFLKTMKYIDTVIPKFIENLRHLNFFDNGILIITGDHRVMLPYTSQEEDTYGKMGVARVPLFIIGLENNYGISQNLPFSHTSLNGLLQYLNLPYAKIYEFNRIPIDKIGVAYEEKPIFYQIHEPEDKVLVLFHEKQFVVHLNGDNTSFDTSIDQKTQDEILSLITWIRN